MAQSSPMTATMTLGGGSSGNPKTPFDKMPRLWRLISDTPEYRPGAIFVLNPDWGSVWRLLPKEEYNKKFLKLRNHERWEYGGDYLLLYPHIFEPVGQAYLNREEAKAFNEFMRERRKNGTNK